MSKPQCDKPNEERDGRVLELWERVLEVEQRLIPTGLHVFGRAAGERECADLLRAVASFERPDNGRLSLNDLVSEGLGLGSYEHLLRDKTEQGWHARARVDEAVRVSIEVFLHEGTTAACSLLESSSRVESVESLKVFELLGRIREQLLTGGGVEALTGSVRGAYEIGR